ncbi:MAG TPA: universal stress protein [Phycisphaerae bacterium]|nr:universal stress protein [Phycisphaerae bacterium]
MNTHDPFFRNVERYLAAQVHEATKHLHREAAPAEQPAAAREPLPVLKKELLKQATEGRVGIRRILAAVDHKEHPAVETAAVLAEALGADVGIVYVVDRELIGSRTGFLYPRTLEMFREEGQREVEEIERTLPKGLRGNVFMREGDPAEEIVKAAEEFGADVIVIGTHRRGVLTRFFLGSVSQGVMRRAKCAVLLVEDPGAPEEPAVEAAAGEAGASR